MIDVSVAVVVFNQSSDELMHILAQFNKLTENSKYSHEFYLIDNSSDNEETIKFFNQKSLLEKINVIKMDENLGFGFGHNAVLNLLESKVHIFMNPDIQFDSLSRYDAMIDYLLEDETIGAVSPLILNPDKTPQHLVRNAPTVFDLAIRFIGPNFFKSRQEKFMQIELGYDSPRFFTNASGSFLIVKTEVLKKIGGFDTRYFMYMEDTDLSRTISNNWNVLFYPYFSVIHLWARENHNIKGMMRMIRSMVMYFNKWGWKVF
ncbi:glycosyltransferase family 2 protein [Weissella cibaria]|uniref:glycosyltransferase n=1 Tax=Weissella TaxID=46255 RepID=UPI001CD59405|nr:MULTISPECIES: glycosyltransferase family 2 protein [Weissella]MCA1354717.1 glycosyltransferase family 2 protein [Weissella cibaria]MDQ2125050.1 glycosyltransferase family 2 protein [Weissella cibaria]MDQ2157965.1 glycosyltransferase family 2 protein [Weissella cibaria]UYY90080.1 glycosyltransferase family 2 protein [Weissella confusa]